MVIAVGYGPLEHLHVRSSRGLNELGQGGPAMAEGVGRWHLAVKSRTL